MKSFKPLLVLFAAASILFIACSSIGNNNIIKTDSSFVKWENGVQVKEAYVEIKPTFGQGFYYAFKSGYALQLIIGILLIMAGTYFVYRKSIDRGIGEKKAPLNMGIFILILFLLNAGGIAFIVGKPSIIANDNNKRITKFNYDQVIQRDGNLKAIWDSVYQNNKMQGAAFK